MGVYGEMRVLLPFHLSLLFDEKKILNDIFFFCTLFFFPNEAVYREKRQVLFDVP